ncbi:MAG: tRNA pseudouridine(38-40) synthase TruA [Phycisphaerales bacterium]|nr:MAG: tRNA pseudouridine(38-40) synthase TruA [Phycisphaerales bacterium]
MPRYKLTIAYDGTSFHGWQKQHPPGEEPLRTVQGVMEEAIVAVVREPVHLVGASRTDSGVHARGQAAAFDTQNEIPMDRLPRAVNSRLPDDVQVLSAEIVAGDFNPISDAIAKGYRYTIAHSTINGGEMPLFDRHLVAWTVYTLDAARMNEAAQHFVGERDFASFTRKHHGRESTVRTVHECKVEAVDQFRINIDISGGGFLYNMVRIIAGTLLEVGRGKLEPGAIAGIIEARDRASAGPTMPPEGLCLMWVKYPGSAQPA